MEVDFTRTGIIATTLANIFRGKRSRAYKLEDFVPKFGPRRRQTVDEMKELLLNFAKGRERE